MGKPWRSFVLDCLQASGIPLREAGGIYTLQVPEHLGSILGVAGNFSFALAESQAGAEVDYLTIGHPFLDKLIGLGLQRGLTGCLIFPHLERTPPAIPPGSRLVFHQEYLFNFHAAYLGYEPVEKLHSLQIDAFTETPLPPLDLTSAAGVQLPTFPSGENYGPWRLYRLACGVLEEVVEGERRRVEETLRQGLARDVQRLEDYYQALMQEELAPLRQLFHQLAVASVHHDLARTEETQERYYQRMEKLKGAIRRGQRAYDRRVEELKKEHEARLRELQEQAKVRAEIKLVSAALLWVPRWELELRQGEELHTCLYDPLRHLVVEPPCGHCGGLMDRIIDNPRLLCSNCRSGVVDNR
ncbi:MAG: hypothetical protein ACOYD6_07865 [Limnochordia bacterium]|jgi:hypothetical protein